MGGEEETSLRAWNSQRRSLREWQLSWGLRNKYEMAMEGLEQSIDARGSEVAKSLGNPKKWKCGWSMVSKMEDDHEMSIWGGQSRQDLCVSHAKGCVYFIVRGHWAVISSTLYSPCNKERYDWICALKDHSGKLYGCFSNQTGSHEKSGNEGRRVQKA